MERNDFFEITKRIEAINPGKKFSKLQFEEWWDSFKGEEYDIALEAFELMKDEYGYFPMPATLRTYITKAKQIRQAEKERKERVQFNQSQPESRDRHRQWMRYIYRILETKQFPKTSEEAIQAKEGFEEKHPDWQPKHKEVKRGPEEINEILKGKEV